MNRINKGKWFLKGLVFFVVIVGLIGLVVMLLWNWLVPDLFHGPVINFWQALGLFALSKILFHSFSKNHDKHERWKPFMKSRWDNMSDEHKERFKQKMKEKWCSWGDNASTQSNAPKE